MVKNKALCNRRKDTKDPSTTHVPLSERVNIRAKSKKGWLTLSIRKMIQGSETHDKTSEVFLLDKLNLVFNPLKSVELAN